MPCGCVLLAYLGLSILDGEARTLRFEINDWKNTSWGFHAIDRWRTRCEVAISADGSRLNRCDSEYFRHYMIRDGGHRHHSLYLRASNSAYLVDDERRTAVGGECNCTWTQRSLTRSDDECAAVARDYLTEPQRIGIGQIAGQKVVRVRSVYENGTVEEVALAPDRRCEVMEERRTHRGTLGIPGARWHYLVTSYIAGEPDAALFKVPAGYLERTKN